jgi:hypothetical protein
MEINTQILLFPRGGIQPWIQHGCTEDVRFKVLNQRHPCPIVHQGASVVLSSQTGALQGLPVPSWLIAAWEQ